MSDLISRQAAIDLWVWGDTDKWRDSKVVHIEDIEALPSAQPEVLAHGEGELYAQPEQRWIPCSEKLPEDNEEVLVTIWDDTVLMGYFETCIDGKIEFNTEDFSIWEKDDLDRITAWMPLPKPYKEVKNASTD